MGKRLNRAVKGFLFRSTFREGCPHTGHGRSATWGLFQVGQGRSARENAVCRLGDNGASTGGKAAGNINPLLPPLEKVDQPIQLGAIGEAILLLSLTQAGKRQGVIQLR